MWGASSPPAVKTWILLPFARLSFLRWKRVACKARTAPGYHALDRSPASMRGRDKQGLRRRVTNSIHLATIVLSAHMLPHFVRSWDMLQRFVHIWLGGIAALRRRPRLSRARLEAVKPFTVPQKGYAKRDSKKRLLLSGLKGTLKWFVGDFMEPLGVPLLRDGEPWASVEVPMNLRDNMSDTSPRKVPISATLPQSYNSPQNLRRISAER